MIIVRLEGGLGNQMFQYALGKAMSLSLKTRLILDINSFNEQNPLIVQRTFDLTVFPITADIALPQEAEQQRRWKNPFHKVLNRLGIASGRYIKEKGYYRFDPSISSLKGDLYLDGYWQSYKYFEQTKDIIQSEFYPQSATPQATQEILKDINSSESVCINVRRTDFVHHPRNSAFHGFCDIDYFDAAVLEIKKRVVNPKFFVFSDDLEWCRKYIVPRYAATIVEHDAAGEKFEWYLYLISKCKHQIIPNSSFGWWGAWLNTNQEKIVVAPLRWTNNNLPTDDLIPDTWLRAKN